MHKRENHPLVRQALKEARDYFAKQREFLLPLLEGSGERPGGESVREEFREIDVLHRMTIQALKQLEADNDA